MYKQISKNKRNSIFFMIGFAALFGLVGWIVGFFAKDYYISLWIIIGVIIYVIVQYIFSSQLAVLLTHAQPIEKQDNPNLFKVVENMAITVGIPTPKIYIIKDDAPNAFSAGKNPETSIMGFTTGLLAMVDKNELEGVVSHEMGHIKNYDVRFKTIIMAMSAAIALMVDISLRVFLVSGRNSKNALPFILIALTILVIVWPLSRILQSAAGREREYLADVTGAEMTRYPEGLISALEKISHYIGKQLKTSDATSLLFFDNPNKAKGFLAEMFATHPPIEERIARLRNLGF